MQSHSNATEANALALVFDLQGKRSRREQLQPDLHRESAARMSREGSPASPSGISVGIPLAVSFLRACDSTPRMSLSCGLRSRPTLPEARSDAPHDDSLRAADFHAALLSE